MQEADDKFCSTFQQHLGFTVSHYQTPSKGLSCIVSLDPYKPNRIYQCVWRLQRLNLTAQGSKSSRQTPWSLSLLCGQGGESSESKHGLRDQIALVWFLPPFWCSRPQTTVYIEKSLLWVYTQNQTCCILCTTQRIYLHNYKSVRFLYLYPCFQNFTNPA